MRCLQANKSTVFNESWALGLDWTGLCAPPRACLHAF